MNADKKEIINGDCKVDLLVEDAVIVELKATKAVVDIHRAQCMNYLRATGLHVCLLLSFGNPRVASSASSCVCEKRLSDPRSSAFVCG